MNSKNPDDRDLAAEESLEFATETTSYAQRPGEDLCDSTVYFRDSSFVGRYRLDHLIGKGGFGEVWRGFDSDLQREVAVKIPRRDTHLTKAQLQSSLDEARKVAKLEVPGVAPIYDFGWSDATPYIVSKYIPGGSLRGQMKHGMPRWKGVEVVSQVAKALHRAHLGDIVHRDVKPENILIGANDEAYLTDFGLAVTETEQLSEQAGQLGSIAYMSPEQARGDSHRVDGRTDIYSLGVTLYELLTGRRPFIADSFAQYMDQIIYKEPRPPRTIDDTIPIELERICLKCLSKNMNSRYSTALDLSRELESFTSPDVPTKSSSWSRRSVLFGVGAAMACSVALPIGFEMRRRENGERSLADDYDVWFRAFGREPTPVPWPGQQGSEALVGREADRRILRIASSDPSLVQLGEIRKGRYEIGFTMKQLNWHGRCGLFFGYHIGEFFGDRCAKFRSLRLLTQTRTNGERYFSLVGSGVRLQSDTRCISKEGKLHLSHELATPRPGSESRIELTINEGILVNVRWDGEPVPVGREEFNCIGAWGLIGDLHPVWFKDPHLDKSGVNDGKKN